MTMGLPAKGSLGNPLALQLASSGQNVTVKQITGVAASGWVVYESSTDAFAMPSPISGAIGPTAASLAGPQNLKLDTGSFGAGNFSAVAFFRNANQLFCWANGAIPSFTVVNYFTGTVINTVQIETLGANPANISAAISPVDEQFVVAYGVQSNLAPRFARISSTGSILQNANTDPSTGAIVGQSSVAFSSNGDFVIAFQDNNGNAGKFVRRNSSGTVQGSVTTIEASGVGTVDCCYLPNGEFVVAYTSTTSVKFARYNASGTLQGSITTVETIGANTVAVAASGNGEFVITYAGTNYLKFARYNASGVLQGTITTVKSVTVGSNDVVFDDNGNFVIAYNSNSTAVEVAAYSPAGVSIGGQKVAESFNGIQVQIAYSPYFFGLSYSGAARRPYFSRVFPNSSYVIPGICNGAPSSPSAGAVPISVVTKGIPTVPTAFAADFRSVGGVAITTGAYK